MPRCPVPDVSPRLVRLVTRLNIGGPARHALLLTRCLTDEFPTTLAAGAPDPIEGEMADDCVELERLPLVRRIDPWADRRAFVAARDLIDRVQPAVVHTHMAKAGAL